MVRMPPSDAQKSLEGGAAPAASDEISLRELYLVLRRRIVLIAAVALVAGAGAYVLLASRSPTFVAEASAVVSRAPVSVTGESGLQFRPELDVTYETYSTLAYSRGVLEAVSAAVPAANMNHGRLREALELVRLAGSTNQPSSLLAVAHRARVGDASIAASLATAWARATIAAVQAFLQENLAAVERITSTELELARANLERSDQALRDFREANDDTADPGLLAGTRQRAVALAVRRDEVQRQVAAREAELASLGARGDVAETVALVDAPDVPLTVTGALWALEARIAGLRAELELLMSQEAQVGLEIEALAAAIARVQTTVAGLERAVLRADAEVASLSAIEPTVAYIAQLAPAGARVLGEATAPATPEGRPTLLVALLVVVVVGFVGVVLVLLADAVRDPARAPR